MAVQCRKSWDKNNSTVLAGCDYSANWQIKLFSFNQRTSSADPHLPSLQARLPLQQHCNFQFGCQSARFISTRNEVIKIKFGVLLRLSISLSMNGNREWPSYSFCRFGCSISACVRFSIISFLHLVYWHSGCMIRPAGTFCWPPRPIEFIQTQRLRERGVFGKQSSFN